MNMTAEETRELHNQQVRIFRDVKHPGTNCLTYGREIRTFFSEHNVHSMLDYGSGMGEQYNGKNNFHNVIGLPRVDIDLYDIGVRTHDKLPKNIYDCVLAVDVLNYVPEALFEFELNQLYSRACNVFAVVNLRPTDPLAVTRRPSAWWDEVFCSFHVKSRVIYYGSTLKDNGVRTYFNGSRIS